VGNSAVEVSSLQDGRGTNPKVRLYFETKNAPFSKSTHPTEAVVYVVSAVCFHSTGTSKKNRN